MKPRSWLVSASLPRLLVELGILATVLTSLLVILAVDISEEIPSRNVLGIGAFSTALVLSPYAALRLQLSQGDRRTRVLQELGYGLLLIASITTLAWTVMFAGTAIFAPETRIAGVDPFTLILGYVFWRGLTIVWPYWDRLRKTRLLWTLAHAQSVATVLIATVITTVLTFITLRSIDLSLPAMADLSGPASVFAWAMIQLVIVVNLFIVLLVAVAIVLIPPATFASLYVLRGTMRRIDDLTRATARLRSDDLSTRVPVGGDDEIAALQSDFNAMAANLERLMDELRDERDTTAQLLESRRQLIASVSHELRTPVATVRGYLESAYRRWSVHQADEHLADVQTMSREIERLQYLIDDLFALARLEVDGLRVTIGPVDVKSVVQRCVEASAPLSWEQRRVQVLADVRSTLPEALGDEVRLHQVVRNLVDNAVRHTPPGGLVMVGVEPHDSALDIVVRDTGEGISDEDLGRIWDRFHRGTGGNAIDRSGTGLGLALVKELTEAMGGTTHVESTVGEGSCFTVRLPLAFSTEMNSGP